MILKIRKSTDPILREPCSEVADFDHQFQFLIDNMIETMRKDKGVGLAAPQIGISKKIFVCEFEGDPDENLPAFPLTVICNPKIVKESKDNKFMVEGCLSFPGRELLIKRPKQITIEGFDRHGEKITIKADGLYSRVIQHENDHLHSTLFIDKLHSIDTVFIGTGSLGLKSLELLSSDKQYNILAVITGEVSASGRNKDKVGNPISELAKKLKLKTIIANDIKSKQIIDQIKQSKPHLGIMADFGQIIPAEILNIFKYGVVNIHPSLLPRYRGPSPIQNTILSGDKKTGVTLILANEKCDAGDIISQVVVKLSLGETSGTLKEYLSDVGANLLLNSIPYYISGDLKPAIQSEKGVSMTQRLKKEDGFVDKNTPAIEVERKIRAFDVWPKVYTIVNGKRIQLLSSHFEEDGQFVLDRVKPEGGGEMTYEEYLRGRGEKLTFS